MASLTEALEALATGRTSAAELVGNAVARAEDPAGEGGKIYTRLYADRARSQAAAVDAARARGDSLPPLAGVPVSVKDLFDIAGEPTTAGSVICRDDPPAVADAEIVARLRMAGAVIVGCTNMTEFAFSGIGINPHYGTPANPYDRATRRVPGGSSSGAAVSVADGTALAAIGTDTGGSVRIPAALCGLTGFKPTARRVPTAGCYPLSPSLDSIGPLAATVADCALVDRVMAGLPAVVPPAFPLQGLRLGVVRDFVIEDLDETVAAAFEGALSRLSSAGAIVTDVSFPALSDLPSINAKGGIVSAEAFHVHRANLEARADDFDPRVGQRIAFGGEQSADDYMTLLDHRVRMRGIADGLSAPFDALLAPTTARVAPPIAELEADDKVFFRYNALMLRNPAVFNFLDRCALSLPIHAPGEAPVGLMVVGETMGDDRLLSVGQALEAALAQA